jgi:CyaY protein
LIKIDLQTPESPLKNISVFICYGVNKLVQDSEFAIKVEKILDGIVQDIEEQDPEGDIDLDLNDGILTLTTDQGTFVVNKQSAAKEIWLSSPISGPYHFVYSKDSWSSRKGADLFEVLSGELKIKFSR